MNKAFKTLAIVAGSTVAAVMGTVIYLNKTGKSAEEFSGDLKEKALKAKEKTMDVKKNVCTKASHLKDEIHENFKEAKEKVEDKVEDKIEDLD